MKRSDIPFATDDAHAFLPLVIGVMSCLAALLLCLGITLGSWIVDRHSAYQGNFTISIPGSDDLAAKLPAIRELLHKTPGVATIDQLTSDSMKTMLKPWLGEGASVENLPLPTLIDVTAAQGAAPDLADLKPRLAALAPGAEIDAHEQWMANFAHFSAAMQGLMALLATLIVGSLAMMIAFTSRASLKLHAKTVSLLHSMGCDDIYITRQFQRDAFRLCLQGALPGCLLAGAIYWAAGAYVASLPSSIFPALAVTWPHLALLAAMPVACGVVAWLAAQLAVTQQLRHVL